VTVCGVVLGDEADGTFFGPHDATINMVTATNRKSKVSGFIRDTPFNG
jgi:hypothetical protein